jgi:hypothetical protein
MAYRGADITATPPLPYAPSIQITLSPCFAERRRCAVILIQSAYLSRSPWSSVGSVFQQAWSSTRSQGKHASIKTEKTTQLVRFLP